MFRQKRFGPPEEGARQPEHRSTFLIRVSGRINEISLGALAVCLVSPSWEYEDHWAPTWVTTQHGGIEDESFFAALREKVFADLLSERIAMALRNRTADRHRITGDRAGGHSDLRSRDCGLLQRRLQRFVLHDPSCGECSGIKSRHDHRVRRNPSGASGCLPRLQFDHRG